MTVDSVPQTTHFVQHNKPDRRTYAPPPPKRYVLDIGDEIILQAVIEEHGFGGAS
jgi:hypothetical protein